MRTFRTMLKNEMKLSLRDMNMFIFAIDIHNLFCDIVYTALYRFSSFFGVRISGSIVAFLGSYLLVMLSIFSIGMMVGGISPNSQTASGLQACFISQCLFFQEQPCRMR